MHLEISEQKIITENVMKNQQKDFLSLDSVPGGTGFLRELWSKDSFFDVIAMVQKVFCLIAFVKSHLTLMAVHVVFSQEHLNLSIHSFPRKEGIKYLEEIFKHKDGMEIVHKCLDEVDVSSFLDSELSTSF